MLAKYYCDKHLQILSLLNYRAFRALVAETFETESFVEI